MGVRHWGVSMDMGMRRWQFCPVIVRVLMVKPVLMFVLMLHRLVAMHVVVPFPNMYPNANGHQAACDDQPVGQRIVQNCDGDYRAEKRSH